MTPFEKIRRPLARAGLALATLLWLFAAPVDANPCAAKTSNPCAAKVMNPCAAKALNPCAAKTLNPCAANRNPCNPCMALTNPCGGTQVDPSRFKQPRGLSLAGGQRSELVRLGKKLWNDRNLGTSGLACATCHVDNYGQMNASFATPYPHRVAMPAQQAGVSEVSAAEMVNFCMIVPMRDEPLDWSSKELAALTAWVEHIQPGYRPVAAPAAANPCNPCGAAMNPCNPCAAKRNPCNPCGAR